MLVGTGEEFGFDPGRGCDADLHAVSAVVAAGATAATLSARANSRRRFSHRRHVLCRVRQRGRARRFTPGLVDPSIDPFRFVWSAQARAPRLIIAFETNGHAASRADRPAAAAASVVSIDVSRDGTRMLLYLQTALGPRLYVAGIIRQQDNVPIALGCAT